MNLEAVLLNISVGRGIQILYLSDKEYYQQTVLEVSNVKVLIVQ